MGQICTRYPSRLACRTPLHYLPSENARIMSGQPPILYAMSLSLLVMTKFHMRTSISLHSLHKLLFTSSQEVRYQVLASDAYASESACQTSASLVRRQSDSVFGVYTPQAPIFERLNPGVDALRCSTVNAFVSGLFVDRRIGSYKIPSHRTAHSSMTRVTSQLQSTRLLRVLCQHEDTHSETETSLVKIVSPIQPVAIRNVHQVNSSQSRANN